MYIVLSVLFFQFVREAVVRELSWRLSLKALSNKDKQREVADVICQLPLYCSLMVTVSIFISTALPTRIHNGTHLISSITGLVARVEGNDRGDIERTLTTENAPMSVEGI